MRSKQCFFGERPPSVPRKRKRKFVRRLSDGRKRDRAVIAELVRERAAERAGLPVVTESESFRGFTSNVTKQFIALRPGTYPVVQIIAGKPQIIMIQAPIINEAERLTVLDNTPIFTALEALLEGIEITLKRPTVDKDGNVVESVVTGLDCLWPVLQATAPDYPVFAKILELKSYVMNPAYQSKFEHLRLEDGSYREPTIDELCAARKTSPDQFVALFYTAVKKFGEQRAKLRIDLSLRSVVDASVESAVAGGKSGFRDRELLFKAAKLVEGSGGVNVNVNQQMNFTAPGVEQGLPAWGDVRKEVTGRGEVKQLEAGVEWVDAEVEAEEKELVNALP
jgi:hypothetical protein